MSAINANIALVQNKLSFFPIRPPLITPIIHLINLSSERGEVQYQLAQYLRERNGSMEKKIEDLGKAIQPLLDLLVDFKASGRIGYFLVKLVLGTAAVLTGLGTIGYFARKAILNFIHKE